MRPHRAICVHQASGDPPGGTCPVVEASLASAGLIVEHVVEIPRDTAGVAVVVVDRAVRRAAGEALRGLEVPVVVVGDDLDDDGLIALMLDTPVSHLVGDLRDRELEITSEKLASGDVFGLEKYLADGAKINQRVVRTDADKRRAMDEVCAWAESVGARRAVLHRIASVVDELVMNALLNGARGSAPDLVLARAGEPSAVLRWAADDETLAISVGDGAGTLGKREIVAHVRRARGARGQPRPSTEGGGAGLGLYLVLSNVASLVVNVEPGRRTEVVCLFDLARGHRPAISRVRSLHVFAG